MVILLLSLLSLILSSLHTVAYIGNYGGQVEVCLVLAFPEGLFWCLFTFLSKEGCLFLLWEEKAAKKGYSSYFSIVTNATKFSWQKGTKYS